MTTQKKYPFKFLDAYERQDRDIFFGRDEEVETLYQMVFQTDLILVYGASGTGKTSLIKCGLASKFQPYEWLAFSIRRGDDLNESLEKALSDSDDGSAAPADNLDWLDEAPAAGPAGASPIAQRVKSLYLRHFKPVFLIFDQFEELYILGTPAEQQRFVDTVQEILRLEQPVKVILSIREEYLGYLYEFERKVPELLRKKLRIEPMNLERVQTVVRSIGALPDGNVRLQSGEEAAIGLGIFEKLKVREYTRTIELPYLQVFLDKLYLQTTGDQERQAEARFSLADIQKMGDIGNVLSTFLDEQVQQNARTLHTTPETIKKLLSPFVTLDGTKDPLSVAQLHSRLPELDTAFISRSLQAFQHSRILRFDEKEQRYEVAHDSLARQIATYQDAEDIALQKSLQMIRTQLLLEAEKRDFFSERQLQFVEPYLAKMDLSAEERDWIEQSRTHAEAQKAAAAEREREELEKAKQQADQERALREAAVQKARQARQRTRLAAGVAALAVAVGVLAFLQWRKAEQATLNAEDKTRAAVHSDSVAQVAATQAEQQATAAKAARNEANQKLTEALREKKQRLQGELTNAQRALGVYQKAGYDPLVTETKAKIQSLQSQMAQTDHEISKATAQ